ncbi:efflux RND transporter periplasmic adaptor subunit [uncultured Hoeflea sp.]|uniref:efflux RND transporter periplasmic adaptor subunit n=1 Tax=uncultured Hoeflea sp. TaxID=538666 RepID=UPI002608DC35|nr:efflux RND transporter periplasmic adaptor subunit [uncultured Hoeflea sp.]
MTDSPIHNPGTRKRRWLLIVLSLAALTAVLLVIFEAEDTADVTAAKAPPAPPPVTVVEAPRTHTVAQISAFAELRPRWDAEIRAAVSGRITKVHDAALAGERVAAGTPLFSIERTQYVTAVAAAELRLEEAKLGLWRARNAVELARQEFQRNSTEPPNELALRLPELKIAERMVASAETELEAARLHLANCEVAAPFSGFITKRMASLGQTLSVGEPMVHLSDDRQYELAVELGEADWALLNHPIAGRIVSLAHRDGTPLGQATIRRGGGFLDPQTRQRRIFMEVTAPGEALLAGDYVKVSFQGRRLSGTLSVPDTALTRAGYVWIVDGDGLLARLKPHVLFRDGARLVIRAPAGDGPFLVATTPLASFLPGQRVMPRQLGD